MIRPDTDAIIDFLNEVAALDPGAMIALVSARVPCSGALLAHPSVQVAAGDPPRVGLLGILNGYAGTIEGGTRDGWGPIAAIVDEGKEGSIRFVRADAPPEAAA